MLSNYLKIALRTIRRRKGYAFLNVLGLAVGLAGAFFILLWVSGELRYDRFHERGDALYRVMRHARFGGNTYTWSSVPMPLAEVLERDFPEIEHAMLLSWREQPILSRGDESFRERGHYAGPAFFEMFSFPLLAGDPATALSAPDAIVVSETLAAKLFGPDFAAEDVLGQRVTVERRQDFRITGIAEDVPPHSSIQFDFVLPMEDYLARNPWTEHWGNSGMEIYVELQEDASAAALNEKIAGIIEAHHEDSHATPFLQPFEAMRLYGNYRDGALAGGRIVVVRVFVFVAAFLLLIAAINFMNLATARSTQRAREIGVRKSLGASRGALVRQFLAESVGLALVAYALALGLVAALLPPYNALTGADAGFGDLGPAFFALGAAIAVGTGLLAGSYPALYLSAFDPAAVLRGTFQPGKGAARFRQGLVVFQFALSALLIVGTLTVYLQMDYIREKDLGLDREHVVTMALEGPAREQFEAFRQELLSRPGIEAVTAASQSPLNIGSSTSDPTWPGKAADDNTLFSVLNTRHDFVETMRMGLVAGRSFSRDFPNDTASFVINERAAAAIGEADPIGLDLAFWGTEGRIVGVVKDFHMASLYSAIEPTILRLDPGQSGVLFVRTVPGRTAEALASLEAVYGRFNAGFPFEYRFLDDAFDEMYRSERTMGTLASLFAAVAVLIACLGLFGLAAYTAERRTKEIGVRKVLGASVPSLVGLLSKEFAALVLVALAVAIPVAWYLMRSWLDTFAYRIALGPWIFVFAGLLALAVALATVSVHALRAATADPVKALRYE